MSSGPYYLFGGQSFLHSFIDVRYTEKGGKQWQHEFGKALRDLVTTMRAMEKVEEAEEDPSCLRIVMRAHAFFLQIF